MVRCQTKDTFFGMVLADVLTIIRKEESFLQIIALNNLIYNKEKSLCTLEKAHDLIRTFAKEKIHNILSSSYDISVDCRNHL